MRSHNTDSREITVAAFVTFAGIDLQSLRYGVREATALAYLGRLGDTERKIAAVLQRSGRPDAYFHMRELEGMLETALLLGDRELVVECADALAGAAAMSVSGPGGSCPARRLGDAMAFLGERERAQGYY